MAYEFESNASILLSDIIDPATGRSRQGYGNLVDSMLEGTGISFKQVARDPTNVSVKPWERQNLTVSEEGQKANQATLESLGSARLTGTNVRGVSGKPAYTNQIVSDSGEVLASQTEDYKKISGFDQVFEAGVKSFLSAAFAGAAGFGPLAASSSAPSALSSLGTIGRSAVSSGIQGAVNSAISGQDPLKGGLRGLVSGGITGAVAPTFGSSVAGRAATGAVSRATTSAIFGGDPLTAGVLGAIGGANLGKVAGLDGAAANFVNQLASVTAASTLQQQRRKTRGG